MVSYILDRKDCFDTLLLEIFSLFMPLGRSNTPGPWYHSGKQTIELHKHGVPVFLLLAEVVLLGDKQIVQSIDLPHNHSNMSIIL